MKVRLPILGLALLLFSATHSVAQPAARERESIRALVRDARAAGTLDGIHDAANMPLAGEPQRVLDDLDALRANRGGRGHDEAPKPS